MSGLVLIGSIEQLEEWMQKSFQKSLFLYKHSTQCGSSRNAHVAIHHFITRFPQLASHFLFAVVRAIEEKQVSDQITNEFGISHLSPQILLIHQRKVVWNASHQKINSNNLCSAANDFLQNLQRGSENRES